MCTSQENRHSSMLSLAVMHSTHAHQEGLAVSGSTKLRARQRKTVLLCLTPLHGTHKPNVHSYNMTDLLLCNRDQAFGQRKHAHSKCASKEQAPCHLPSRKQEVKSATSTTGVTPHTKNSFP